jgi:hypothetical protein
MVNWQAHKIDYNSINFNHNTDTTPSNQAALNTTDKTMPNHINYSYVGILKLSFPGLIFFLFLFYQEKKEKNKL